MVANPMNFFSATYLFKNQPIPNCEQCNCKERNFAEGRMHDKGNDNCVRESCTQYVILRVLHPPFANLHDIRQDTNNCMETQ